MSGEWPCSLISLRAFDLSSPGLSDAPTALRPHATSQSRHQFASEQMVAPRTSEGAVTLTLGTGKGSVLAKSTQLVPHLLQQASFPVPGRGLDWGAYWVPLEQTVTFHE